MRVEKSAGAIVFRRHNKKTEYLLLHYGAGHWDFPKGHIEKGESEEDALRREVFEETGIKDLRLIPGFRKMMRYFFRGYSHKYSKASRQETIMKIVFFYLAETKAKKVKLSFEHTGYKWLPYPQAKKQLTFQNAKKLLREAHKYFKS